MSLFWGILQPAPSHPSHLGSSLQVHLSILHWPARRDGRMPLYVKSHESFNFCFPFHLTPRLMVFLYTPTATETCSQGGKIV